MSNSSTSELQRNLEDEGFKITDTQIRTETETIMLAEVGGVSIEKDTKRVVRWMIWSVCSIAGAVLLQTAAGWLGAALGFGLIWLSNTSVMGGYSVFVSTQSGRRRILRFGYFDPFADGPSSSNDFKSCPRAYNRAKAVADAISNAIARKQTQGAEP